jgi:aldehyde dehydrogenase (NAD+)
MQIKPTLKAQRTLFNSNITKDIKYRKAQLALLKHTLKSNESALFDAIYQDFRKSPFETYATELSMIYHEIDLAIKQLDKWAKPQRVTTDFANFPAKSYIYPEPLGTVLVIGAWNYPYQLSLAPVVAALSAGNTVVLKPSEIAPHTSAIMAELINEAFDPSYLHVIEGGIPETTAILEERFDMIFFTGSTTVGKIIYQAAAKHLTPVVLELGGKSPTFVLSDANIEMAVQRIVWAKFLNAGQTCIAPDYILVDSQIKDAFVTALSAEVTKRLSDTSGENYTQIINERNFNRLTAMIDEGKVIYGNEQDSSTRTIAPTIMDNVIFEDEVMQEEIFGPILPIIAYDNLDEAITKVKEREKPLSCYIYTESKKLGDKIIGEVSFGGGAVNDSIMHLTNPRLPFGGVGASGMGHYHGKFGFNSFSHHKSIIKKSTLFEAPFKYTPYSEWKLKLMRLIMG